MRDLKQLKSDFAEIPFENVVRLGARDLLYSDLFCVTWLLGRFCNYKCSYCWSFAHSKVRDHRPTKVILKTLDEIKRQAKRQGFNSFHFSFAGGEPTLHPGYLDILKHYCDDLPNTKYQSLHMCTNLSPTLAWFKKFVDITKNLHRVRITASWHPEFAKKEPFVEKVLFCMENDISININIVMIPERFNKLWKEVLYFHKQGINVTPKLKLLFDSTAGSVDKGYTKDMLELARKNLPHRNYALAALRWRGKKSIRPRRIIKYGDSVINKDLNDNGVPLSIGIELTDNDGKKWYMDYAERLNAFGFNKFKNWECSSGFRSVAIREPHGLIKRCNNFRGEPLGSIESGFKLFNYPRRCMKPTCISSPDSKIPKRAPGTKLPLWPGDKTFKKTIKY